MDFNSAIKSHSNWKQKLSSYLKDPNGSLKADEIKPDNLCDLGKWLHSDAKEMMPADKYDELLNTHANFHAEAATIVEKADSGENTSEDVALGGESPYAKCSSKVISLLMELKSKE